MWRVQVFLVFILFLGSASAQDGNAALIGGSGSTTSTVTQIVYFSSDLNPQSEFTILKGALNNKPYAIQFPLGSSGTTWSLGGSISTTCTDGVYGQISLYLESGSEKTLVAIWTTQEGSIINAVNHQGVPSGAYFYLTFENVNIDTGTCTTTISNVQFGLLSGAFPGPSGSYAYIGDGSGSFTGASHQYGNMTGYTSQGSEGSPEIYLSSGTIYVPGPAIIVLGVNGSFGSNCWPICGVFASFFIYENDNIILTIQPNTYQDMGSFEHEFTTLSAGIVPSTGAYYYVTVSTPCSDGCTDTWSGIYLGVNVIINT